MKNNRHVCKLLFFETIEGIKHFFSRFYFEPIVKYNLVLLPCLHINFKDETFETTLFFWSFVIFYGKINR